ncbi:MAG: hypothetical protein U0R80_02955 [Nocardioidaceae bacterium]
MTEERLRELLHDSVSGTASAPDLAETAWRHARRRRRLRAGVTVGAVAVLVTIGATGVRLLTPDASPPPVGPPHHSATHPPTTPTPSAARPDASHLGVPVWWAPADPVSSPAVAAEQRVLPGEVDLSTPAPDAAEQPIPRAVAAFCDVGSLGPLSAADGHVRLVAPGGEERDLDVSGLRGLAWDGVGRLSPVDHSMLSPDGRTLVFPQDDHAMLFDIPTGTWSRLDVRARQGTRWADATTLYLPALPAGAAGRLVDLDGTREGRANLTDVVRPGIDLGDVSLVGPWRAGGEGAVAQTYDGRRGTVPGPDGDGADQTYVVVRGAGDVQILVLGPTDEPGWSLLADWLDPQTLVIESVDVGTDEATLTTWQVGTHTFSLLTSVTGLSEDDHHVVGSYALEAGR